MPGVEKILLSHVTLNIITSHNKMKRDCVNNAQYQEHESFMLLFQKHKAIEN